MPDANSAPKLTDITSNKLYPAYKTAKGTVIQLNGPKTQLPTGITLSALVIFADNCGLKMIIVTAGTEPGGHSKGSFHGKNLANDVAGQKFNKLTHDAALTSARKAGFTHGVYEDFRGTDRDHWHFLIGAGNGLGDKQSLKASSLYIKRY